VAENDGELNKSPEEKRRLSHGINSCGAKRWGASINRRRGFPLKLVNSDCSNPLSVHLNLIRLDGGGRTRGSGAAEGGRGKNLGGVQKIKSRYASI